MKISARRAVGMLFIAFLLCCAAVIAGNFRNQQAISAASATVSEENPIERFRMERQQLRAMQKAQLNDIAHDASTEVETAELARRQLMDICQLEEKELTIEGVLSMRGFQNPVVTVHKGSVNVLIASEAITRQESSVILDLVCRETGVAAGDIKIIPIN